METIKNLTDITNKIQNDYPNCEVIGLREVYLKGWVNNNAIINAYTSPESVVSYFNWLISKGAEFVNFIIKDEYGNVRYPDYKLIEFTRYGQ
jgi:hypothetical protein